MTQTIVVDQLIEQARAATGLETFDSDSYREGLDILVDGFNAQGAPEQAVERMKGSVIQALATRLKTTDFLARHPQLLERPIERPVFVFGIPRTGTTLLSNLLAADPARRSPLTWEIDDPVPPATSATLTTDPRALARLEMEKKMLEAMPEMGKYYRGSAIYPNECVFIMANDFKTLMWESRGKLLGYRDWLFETDMTSAYEYHKQFLQLLQSEAPGTWNLKMPSHALWLDTLLKVYPDARLVWTHRDPLTATGSFCSIISLAHNSFAGGAKDKDFIGQNCLYQAQLHADRIMDTRERLGEERIVDVHYAELTTDPIATMRKLYAALGDEFTAEAQAGMQAWLDDNPQTKFGKHEYKLAEFGLTPETVRPVFERYLSRYDVAVEG
ncbi:sulfotransferase [Mangrovimicrobium sediminis]|uniref:Sulfotransferase n=1 Tax=Mangrovimicrobium sediminis TaxID=2562682 RepID=A0A4Z0M959_9GAMM|nr:sulfotransferase [Haliea sp. SAOS-164]TGD76252.1 sulfotransferase [Haliea sp. SAOS-164]